MQAFLKQAEASLAQAGTGLVVSTLPSIVTPGDLFSTVAICSTAARTPISIMYVVFGLLTSGT